MEKKGYPKILLIISLLITVFITLVDFVFNGFSIEAFTDIKNIGISFLYCFVLTGVNMLFYSWIDERYSWEYQGKIKFISGVLGSVFITVIAYAFCKMVHRVVIEGNYTFSEFWEQQQMAYYFFPFMIAAIISLGIHAFYFFKAVQESKVNQQKIIAGTASAKFDALKNQLDPHFLFNSLNVLTALIDENPLAAQKFTTSLSKVYRYVLEQKNKDLVPIEEELNFAKVYINLLTMRFENSIYCEVPQQFSNPEAKIVPLSLQLLLENAVKHNVISEEKPLRIFIVEEDGHLVVKNNAQAKRVIKNSSGVGLQNIRKRYEMLTSRKVVIEKNAQQFVVKLPLLTKKISVEADTAFTEKQHKIEQYKHAKDKVEEEKSFYGNITAYCIVIPFLVIVNMMTTGLDHPWVLFPIVGWGIGVAFHYMETFDKNLFFGKRWEERKIKEFMNKDNKQNQQ